MAKNKTEYLDNLMSKLPTGIIQHSERCRELSKVIIKHIECEEWFIKDIDDANLLADAIYYHDIGKVKVKKEYLYKDLCANPNDLHNYYEHIDFGLKILEAEDAKNIDDELYKYLQIVVKNHHLKDPKKPIAGIVAFMADFLDNKLYSIKVANKGELTFIKFEFIINEMLSEMDRIEVSKKIIKFIKNKEFIEKFYKYVDKFYNDHDDGLHYGINLKGYNIYDIFQTDEIASEDMDLPIESHVVFGKKISFSLVNRYYGEVKHKDFIYFAMKHSLTVKLDNYFIDNVKLFLDEYELDKNKYLFFDLSITGLSKNIIKKFDKVLSSKGYEPNKVVFSFDFFANELSPLYIENLNIIKSLGYLIAINNIKTSIIDILRQVKFDYAFYDNMEVNNVDSMFAELVQSLGTKMILTKQNIGQYRYICGQEENLLDLADIEDGGFDG